MHRICVVLFGLLWLRRSVAFQICGMVIKPSFKLRSQLLAMSSNLEIIGQSISKSIGKIYRPAQWIGGYGGGGSGASTGNIVDDIGTKFFVKQGNLYSYNMLNAEYEAISEIYRSNTIRVPRPICIDTSDSNAFVVFEYLAVGGTADPVEYAKKLVAMHRVTSPNGMFGWKMNNTIGATFQPNTYTENWATFWDTHRLGHMLDLARREGAYFGNEVELRAKVKALLSKHNCQPSLVHGDLWSGNQGCLATGEPVIFDPAAYVSDLTFFILFYVILSFSYFSLEIEK